ncbi:MAG: HNH endonuclease [Balneolaceae bacterium]
MNSLGNIPEWLRNLNRNRNSKNWDEKTTNRAPHKPFLLLSILDGVEQGWVKTNNIELSQDLKDTFFSYWNPVMGGERNTSISTPFTHLNSEPFWDLIDNNHAIIAEEFFSEMKSEKGRSKIREIILGEFFSADTADLLSEIVGANGEVWEYSIKADMLTGKPFQAFKKSDGKRVLTEKEIQKRDRGFSLNVRRHYDYHCAICKSKILTPAGASLAEGAHIIPWSESYNDDPRNGLALCRNHHWMFDRLLITVRKNFNIEISPVLLKAENHLFRIENINGNTLLLPKNKRFFPAVEALQHHSDRFESYHKDL